MLLFSLKFLFIEKAFEDAFEHKLFLFNMRLEVIDISFNYLSIFPRFCIFRFEISNYECELRKLIFNSNLIKHIGQYDLINMKKLEILKLANNSISWIHSESFIDLINLNHLDLSNNLIIHIGSINYLNALSNLEMLNFSWNNITNIKNGTFKDMIKLEKLDLSWNKIKSIENNAFFNMENLKDLYLINKPNNENAIYLNKNSFQGLNSIQNVYISHDYLKDNQMNKCVFKSLLYQQKGSKKINHRIFYRSINLITNKIESCEHVLEFMKYNIHLNLKSDLDFENYANQTCEKRMNENKLAKLKITDDCLK